MHFQFAERTVGLTSLDCNTSILCQGHGTVMLAANMPIGDTGLAGSMLRGDKIRHSPKHTKTTIFTSLMKGDLGQLLCNLKPQHSTAQPSIYKGCI
jgi:hypothetical protein